MPAPTHVSPASPFAVPRRQFLRVAAASLAVPWFGPLPGRAGEPPAETIPPRVRFGLLTDLHYADKQPAGTRHYRDTLVKLSAAKEEFARRRVDFVVELGDVIDTATSLDVEKSYLQRIAAEFAQFPGRQHFVVGNHCVETLTKAEFLEIVKQPAAHYGFDCGGWHFVVLDACYRSDGMPYGRKNSNWTDANMPTAEVDWLRKDLQNARGPSLVFVHQRLDGAGPYLIKNAEAVRHVLEESGKVRAVFQGHYHKNALTRIHGIPYCTLAGMIEGKGGETNAFAVASVLPDGAIHVEGFGTQSSYRW